MRKARYCTLDAIEGILYSIAKPLTFDYSTAGSLPYHITLSRILTTEALYNFFLVMLGGPKSIDLLGIVRVTQIFLIHFKGSCRASLSEMVDVEKTVIE